MAEESTNQSSQQVAAADNIMNSNHNDDLRLFALATRNRYSQAAVLYMEELGQVEVISETEEEAAAAVQLRVEVDAMQQINARVSRNRQIELDNAQRTAELIIRNRTMWENNDLDTRRLMGRYQRPFPQE